MNATKLRPANSDAKGKVLTKAVIRAAQRLEISNKVLARTIGLSEATISRMGAGEFVLSEGNKTFELAAHFIRLYRSLDALVGGDDTISSTWLRSHNAALKGEPMELIQTLQGFIHVISYLDSRRAIV